ncbi:hypothetical protein [Paraburkholderia sp.]|uniref:hypothetical protein n=1 Tax=Paraburkholderia sp. TaxID=1926495 RepID=UPI003C7A6639
MITTSRIEMRPSTERIKSSLKKLDWTKLKAELDQVNVTEQLAREVLDHVFRADQMVRRHQGDDGKRRDAYLASLSQYLLTHGAPTAAEDVAVLHEIFRRLDKGYSAIYEVERRVPSARLTSSERLALLFRLLDDTVLQIARDIESTNAGSPILAPDSRVKDPDGNEYYANSVYHGLSIAAGDMIMLEAYRENYFNENDDVVLPPLGATADRDEGILGANLALARAWRVWKNIDERTRFLGGELTEFRNEMPEWVGAMGQAAAKLEVAFEFKPNVETEILDILANERFDERMRQNLMQMIVGTNLLDKVAPENEGVALPPNGLLSVDEGHAGVMLGQALSLRLDQARAGSLFLTERLRGYAVLKRLLAALVRKTGSHFAHVSEEDLLAELTRCGLSSQSAQAFIKTAIYRRSSRDVYDQPLIRRADGGFLVFGFSLLHADLTKTVLSSIANEGISVSEKGATFENTVLELLCDNGFQPRNLKVKRGPDNSEYDYDVAFTWGDYVFFLECKNRSIPGGNPVAIYYFNQELGKHVSQVQRLKRGLNEYPDILQSEYPEAMGKTPVFCVVNALPFSMGLQDDIYFIDLSLLGRFFESPTFGHTIGPLRRDSNLPAVRTEILGIWATESPSVDDFLAYIANPPQLRIAAATYELQPKAEWLSDKAVAKVIDFKRKSVSPEEMARILSRSGVDSSTSS